MWPKIRRTLPSIAVLLVITHGYSRADEQTSRLGQQLFIDEVCASLFDEIANANTGETRSLLQGYAKTMRDRATEVALALGLTHQQFEAASYGPYAITHGDFSRDAVAVAYAKRCYALVQ
jgi:hypothetical protein